MRGVAEAPGEHNCVCEKLCDNEKEQTMEALKGGQPWFDLNRGARAEEITKKQEEVEGIIALIVSNPYDLALLRAVSRARFCW